MIADSGGADTTGSEILMTSAVAMLFSCSCWDKTAAPVPLNSVGRATEALVIGKAVSRLTERPRTASTRKYDAIRRKVPVRQRDSGDCPRLYPAPNTMNGLDTKACNIDFGA